VRRRAPRAPAALAGALAVLGALGAVAAQERVPEREPERTPEQAPPASAPLPGVLAPAIAPVIAAQGGPTWQPLPQVAAQARAAVAGLTADPLDAVAHGDPSMGCFVLVLRLGGGGVALHRALHEALAQQTPPWTVSDWTTAGDGTGVRSGFAFAGEALQGEVRVMSRGQQQQQQQPPASDSMLVACFHDAREPARSARLCKRMLPAIEDALHTIPETFP
jgi:hypothetical protein